ncbi:MAG: methionyl-tRNA formyltransferase [Bacteroidales bacterium]|nr:methionyl-tRNA formyltransferase [Bacteroidales bacterium]
MSVSKPGIVFMGTPEFAVASLKAIINSGYTVKGVVTAPDKPSGRGLQMHASPVKQFAVSQNLPVLQPMKLKDPEFLTALRNLKADLQIIVAFRMLPEEVWSMPPLGTFNLHASLLPQYRGAAPINWAIINGESRTGVTTFFLNHEIDKGSVIFTEETSIGENESAGELHDRLMETGARLVVKTITSIAEGTAKTTHQHLLPTEGELKPAPKIFRDDCRIHWKHDVRVIHNLIRGLSPYPAAWTEIVTSKGEITTAKIFAAGMVNQPHSHGPGTTETDSKTFLRVAASNGYINIESIQLQSKKQMSVPEFLHGFQDIAGCRFL